MTTGGDFIEGTTDGTLSTLLGSSSSRSVPSLIDESLGVLDSDGISLSSEAVR
jgi:hypothetical protein